MKTAPQRNPNFNTHGYITEIIHSLQDAADYEASLAPTPTAADWVQLDEAHADQTAIQVDGLTGFSSGGYNEGPFETI